MSYKLFIPGPVEVSDKTYRALTTPVFGHRSPDFVDLYRSLQPGLQELFGTTDPVFLSTSSAWGVMEGAVRNLTAVKVLNCMCGAFSDKWHDVSLRCGKEAAPLQFDWGRPVDPDSVRKELATGNYDAVTIVHNETSTGLMNPIAEIMAVVREYPEVFSIVDAVSSLTVVELPKDELGIDVLLTGSQKGLALPPGLALFSVSQRAMDRAAKVPGRGLYFDFLEFLKNHENGTTPTTPNIPHIFALRSKLEDIKAEGLKTRYARHDRLNGLVHAWVDRNGFELFPEQAYASKSLTCVKNNRGIDVPLFINRLKEQFNCVIDGGYGKLKGKTFRISNMGDETDETVTGLLKNLDTIVQDI